MLFSSRVHTSERHADSPKVSRLTSVVNQGCLDFEFIPPADTGVPRHFSLLTMGPLSNLNTEQRLNIHIKMVIFSEI